MRSPSFTGAIKSADGRGSLLEEAILRLGKGDLVKVKCVPQSSWSTIGEGHWNMGVVFDSRWSGPIRVQVTLIL